MRAHGHKAPDLALPVLPPHNLEAEQAVLGAILLDGSIVVSLIETLHVDDFYRTSHRTIYQSMLSLVAGGGHLDNITLADHLDRRGVLATVGGATYLAELIASVVGTSNVAHHASIVIRAAALRRLREQLVKACSEIDSGADLERVKLLLPDPAALVRGIPGDTAILQVMTVADLLATEKADSDQQWIMDAMIAFGSFLCLIAKPKVGKSTLIYELAVKIALGLPFLGRATRQCGVLVLAVEEPKNDICRRMRAHDGESLENFHMWIGSLTPDEAMIAKIKRTVEQLKIGLIIIDTLNSFWSVEDENNAAQVTRAVKPLLSLARDTNAAVMVVHHARKSEGEYGDEIRGSGALFSLFDCAFILKRHTTDTQRKLTAISRWPETPAEMILELRDHGYECLGDPATTGRQAKLQKLAAALTAEPRTARELSLQAGLALRLGYVLVDQLVRDNRAQRLGTGRKGDPFKFVSCSIERGPA